MATTTPNYGWTVPTSTDLVKDGATAIETLGDAIDASMNTALGTKKAGMVLLNTTSFSAVASVSLPADTFTATYDNYRIVGQISTATQGSLSVRMRASGSDNATSNYQRSTIFNYGTTTGAETALTTTWSLSDNFANALMTFTFDVFSPKLSAQTHILYRGMSDQSAGYVNRSAAFWFTATTSFDAMSFTGQGNVAGKIMVYGLNQ